MTQQEPPNRVAREIDLLWGVREQARRGPKPGLTRATIVGAAVALADAEGLEAVSMQRVAKELGYTTMSLYRHVDSKEDMLLLMGDAALAHAPPERADGDWRAGIGAWVAGVVRQYRSHPWIVLIGLSGPPTGPNGLRWMEAGLRELVRAGLDTGEALKMLLLLSSTLRESVRMEDGMSRAAREAGTTMAEAERAYAQGLGAVVTREEFPTIAAMLADGVLDEPTNGALAGGEPGGPATGLDFGIQRVLDGIEAYVGSARSRER